VRLFGGHSLEERMAINYPGAWETGQSAARELVTKMSPGWEHPGRELARKGSWTRRARFNLWANSVLEETRTYEPNSPEASVFIRSFTRTLLDLAKQKS
jgi:hypothetical protein